MTDKDLVIIHAPTFQAEVRSHFVNMTNSGLTFLSCSIKASG